tara:strand:+ start:543 stop:1028 length:486 start_codon:yes stop_codon:yes gene_type:complete
LFEFINQNSVLIALVALIIFISYLFLKTRSYSFLFILPIITIAGLVVINDSTPEKLEQEIKSAGFFIIEQPTVVEFMSPSCMACIYSRPTVSAMKDKFSDQVDFIVVNVKESEAMDLVLKYKVRSTPTFIMFGSDGLEKTRFSGLARSKIMQESIEMILEN